jgi:hypothetical protein
MDAKHFDLVCENCGFEFEVWTDTDDEAEIKEIKECPCGCMMKDRKEIKENGRS